MLKRIEQIEHTERISKKHLREIAPGLSGRDKEVLHSVRRCRYLTTQQLRHLHFMDAINPKAGLQAANRNLKKLKNLELVGALARRVGGVRAGSGSIIWYLTDAGERLLRLDGGRASPRKRFFEPSPHFLSHTLAVAECYIQLIGICGGHDPKLVKAELEPDCWRTYKHRGKMVTIRPDLSAVTVCGEYEDRWLIEVDLNTEAPVTVVEKCRRYHDYYRCGLEQKQHGVFPVVVWIVPDKARKDSLIAHIRAEFVRRQKMFIVITPDELNVMIRQGVDGGALC